MQFYSRRDIKCIVTALITLYTVAVLISTTVNSFSEEPKFTKAVKDEGRCIPFFSTAQKALDSSALNSLGVSTSFRYSYSLGTSTLRSCSTQETGVLSNKLDEPAHDPIFDLTGCRLDDPTDYTEIINNCQVADSTLTCQQVFDIEPKSNGAPDSLYPNKTGVPQGFLWNYAPREAPKQSESQTLPRCSVVLYKINDETCTLTQVNSFQRKNTLVRVAITVAVILQVLTVIVQASWYAKEELRSDPNKHAFALSGGGSLQALWHMYKGEYQNTQPEPHYDWKTFTYLSVVTLFASIVSCSLTIETLILSMSRSVQQLRSRDALCRTSS